MITLPTVADLKAYARIEHTAEDALLSALIARAASAFEVLCDLPVNARAFTWIDDPTGPGTVAAPAPATRYGRAIVLPHRAVTIESITDGSGAVVPSANYRTDGRSGMVYAVDTRWTNGPYTVAYLAGMYLLPDAVACASDSSRHSGPCRRPVPAPHGERRHGSGGAVVGVVGTVLRPRARRPSRGSNQARGPRLMDAPGLRDQRVRLYTRHDVGADGFPRVVYVFAAEWWGRLDGAPASTRTGQSPQASAEMQTDARLTLAYYTDVPPTGLVLVDETAYLVRGVVRDRLTWRTEVTLSRVTSDTVTRYVEYDGEGSSGGYHLVDPPTAFTSAFSPLEFR